MSVTRPRLNSLLSQLHFLLPPKEGEDRMTCHYLRNNIFAEASSLKAESNFALPHRNDQSRFPRCCRNTRAGNYGTRETRPQSPCDFYAWKFSSALNCITRWIRQRVLSILCSKFVVKALRHKATQKCFSLPFALVQINIHLFRLRCNFLRAIRFQACWCDVDWHIMNSMHQPNTFQANDWREEVAPPHSDCNPHIVWCINYLPLLTK